MENTQTNTNHTKKPEYISLLNVILNTWKISKNPGLSSIGGGFFGAARNAATNAASAAEAAAESAVAASEKATIKAESIVEAAEALGSASTKKIKVPKFEFEQKPISKWKVM